MGGVTKEKEVGTVGVWWILERRIGWEFWRLWRAVSRSEMFGSLERRRAKTVMPVPLGTALHQLYSVPPTGRALSSGGCGLGFWSDMSERGGREDTGSCRILFS